MVLFSHLWRALQHGSIFRSPTSLLLQYQDTTVLGIAINEQFEYNTISAECPACNCQGSWIAGLIEKNGMYSYDKVCLNCGNDINHGFDKKAAQSGDFHRDERQAKIHYVCDHFYPPNKIEVHP